MPSPWVPHGKCPSCGADLRGTTFGQACKACPYDRYDSETQAQALARQQRGGTDEGPTEQAVRGVSVQA